MRREGMPIRVWLILVMVIMPSMISTGSAEEYIQAQAIIGIETSVSGGDHTLSQAVQTAGKNGIDVLVTADAFLNRWQYGLWPLRGIIRKTEETRSVLTFGLKRYLDEIEAVQRSNPDVIVIGGVEAAPFYCWEGSPFKGNFAITEWHKHLIVIGLEGRKSWKRLPVIGNTAGLAKPFCLKGFLCLLFSVLIMLAGLYCMREGGKAQEGVFERRLGVLLAHWRYIGIALLLTGILLLVNGLPFRDPAYDQYHGDCGTMPYQNLIDYVARQGGMTFWAHPEAKNTDKIGKVSIQTGEHTDLLLGTCGYTGFAIFYEGYDLVGRPQGIWDSVLRRYCQGGCRSPVWAIGMLDYDIGRDLGEKMRNLRTVLLVRKKNRAGVLEALKNGRMYVAKEADAGRFRLSAFTVGNASGGSAEMGEEIPVNGAPRITIKGAYADDGREKPPLKVLLIRDGDPLTIFETQGPVNIVYDDKETLEPGKHYYRAEIRSSGLVLVTNPIFAIRE